ncbi:hypothetical protein [Ethanoligenens harbinense]|uniref:Uncharacterized protein n=1 Tax=Ethanoligenens harbinense (strain DSM 18485 / JCM 12961 / CGMCC 1.5033 / YUAN-3) TaxID=663278 RepID=E6U3X3_ETHHY|nr:hypothetical protein [Ethanoligenens harbinense]ADU26540.1 hypothetical protein Ethha_0987 [Ethanoligenens harbinense YUAN-3]AVQ95666.1 hypothetical protein CXQ68_05115 [Ethanoligenens harbinense YUAN-3]AYF38329.1 hypothetical protein CXP51_04975 [Ethanoligenens harbinense]AYF41074.1 hypothetical protein CN246_05105 [Ethanoligenens harbinense]QCN91905.1 hypothetical protein DRA42_05130 [Ethanoligenens harbinense]
MLSPTSFDRRPILRHAWRETWTRNLLLPIIGLVVFIILFPVSTAGMPSSSIFNVDYTHDQLKYRFFDASFGPVITGAVLVYGLLLGIALLRFLHDRRQTVAYFSLGITRMRLLAARLGAGCLMLLIGVGVPLAVSLLLNLAALGYTTSIFGSFFYLLCGYLVLGLVSLFVAGIGCVLAGTLLEAAVFSACLLAIPSAALYGVGALMRHLLFGSASGVLLRTGTGLAASSLLTQFAAFNPALFFYHNSMTYSAFYATTTGETLPAIRPLAVVLWFIGAVILAELAAFALQRRKNEIAGVRGMSHGMNIVLTLTLAFFLYTLLFDVLAALNVFVAFIAATAGFVAVWLAFAVLTSRGKKAGRQNITVLAAGLAATYAGVALLGTGFLGYSARVPNADDIASATISYVGSPNYITGDGTQGSSGANGYYIAQQVKLTDASDLSLLVLLHKTLIAAGKPALELNQNDFEKTAVPYDIMVQYTLKSGSTLVRYYDRSTFSTLESMLTLENTQAVKRLEQNIITGNTGDAYWAAGAYRGGSIYLSNNWYTNPQLLTLSADKRTALLQALAADVAAQPLNDRYFPSKPALGVLMFSQTGNSDTKTYAYNLENAEVYLTSAFTNTLKFLNDNGLTKALSFDGAAESITLMKYNPYVSKDRAAAPEGQYFMAYTADNAGSFILQKDFGKNYVVDAPDQIGELIPLLQNDYYMSRGGYLAAVKLQGSDTYVYKFLPLAGAPKKIRSVVIN